MKEFKMSEQVQCMSAQDWAERAPTRRMVLQDDYDALQAMNTELLEALESTLVQCLAWQGEPDEEWSCAIHVAVCKRARAAIAKARSQA
jgi:hypothetical protein